MMKKIKLRLLIMLIAFSLLLFTACAEEDGEVIEEFVSTLANLEMDGEPSTSVAYELETINRQHGLLVVEGWGYLVGLEEDDVDHYLVLQRGDELKYFTTESLVRESAANGEEEAELSEADLYGFGAKIPEELLDDHVYHVGLYLKSGEKDGIAYTKRFIMEKDEYHPPLADIEIDAEEAEERVIFLASTPHLENGMVSFSGWAFLSGFSTEDLEHYVFIKQGRDKIILKPEAVNTEDVTTHFMHLRLDLDNAGFRVEFPRDIVGSGSYQLGLFLDGGDEKGLILTDYYLDLKEEFISKEADITAEEARQSRTVFYWLDEVKEDGDMISLRGWAFLENRETVDTAHYLVFKSGSEFKVFDVKPHLRTDVTEYFKNMININVDHSGFSARVPKELLPPGKYQVGIFMVTGESRGLVYTDQHYEAP